VGVDELRPTANIADATLADIEVVGQRELTVQCMVESYVDLPDRSALFLCERARTRLRIPSVEAALEVAGIGVIDAANVVDLPYETDGRIFGRAAFDLRINVISSEVDLSQYTIAIVEVTTQWKGPDGELLPDNYQLTAEPIDSTV
jgi:hypothetical protein